jgi:hypothetical protein
LKKKQHCLDIIVLGTIKGYDILLLGLWSTNIMQQIPLLVICEYDYEIILHVIGIQVMFHKGKYYIYRSMTRYSDLP